MTTDRPARWTGSPCRILVLDDDELIVRAVARSLRSYGLIVETTTNPDDALAMAQREEPHVVVSDLHMPKSCGAQFLTSIATVAPGAMRILMSADPEFRPEVGTIAEARVHALLGKSELGALAKVLLALVRGRFETPASSEAREALAHEVALGLARPRPEDEAHRHRTADWASHVATMMNLRPEEVEQARLGAILHDVGQVTVPPFVFARPGELGPADRARLEAHPGAGARIVDAMPALRGGLSVVRSHHERQDGTGYPDGLAGEDIPAAARAFQVADAYEAMTRGRPHALPRSHADAIAELTAHADRQHDSRAVHALASLGEAGLRRG